MLEIVTVCVNYGDFLELCIEQNQRFCDNYIVITTEFDTQTQELCKKYNIQCVKTDVFYKNGKLFNKGAAINEGIKHLKYKDWVLFVDADIRLSDNFNDIITLDKFNPQKFYGCSRRFIWTYQDWLDLQNGVKTEESFPSIEAFGVGIFQLIHYQNHYFQKSLPNPYPDSNNCAEVDIDFLKLLNGGDVRYPNLEKLPMNVLCFGPHGLGHNGRFLSPYQEFRKNFKQMENLSNREIYHD